MDQEPFADNPNPKANIALLVPYAFFYYSYENIYKHLPNAEFVPDPMAPSGQIIPDTLKHKLRNFLREKGVHWRDKELTSLSHGEFFSKYAVLVGPFYKGYIRHPANHDKKKARLFYGGAKDLWGFALWNAFFDLFLTPGPYYVSGLARYSGKAMAIGDPKLDTLATCTREEALSTLGLTLDASKETILVLSTWAELSALRILAPILLRLTAEYNVVVKVHHMTEHFEPETIHLFDGTAVQLLFETDRVAHALLVADIVISDSSGAIFDALLAKKRLVLIQMFAHMEERYVETPHASKLLSVTRRTTENSLEQVVKNEGQEIVPVVRGTLAGIDPITYEKIIVAIKASDDSLYHERIKTFLGKHFTASDGLAGKRGAEAIVDLLVSPIKRDRSLQELVESFETDMKAEERARVEKSDQELSARAALLERVKDMNFSERIRFFKSLS